MRLFRPSVIARWLYHDAIFRIRTTEKLLYLTFDDGPDPESTDDLLDILYKYNIKALFFCDGRAAEKYPDLINRIKKAGHLIGNHGYMHLNGWLTSLKRYVADVIKASHYTSSGFFRPPYGRLRFNQYRELKKRYKIVLWDIMIYDFDTSFGRNKSLRILKKKLRPGSVIVMHDTGKSYASEIIEEFILFAMDKGFRFDNLILFNSSPV
jgi:peptidoglycan/xylan/chitin deacetylase (PgdA/CDA1 family)